MNVILWIINVHSTTGKRQYYLPLWLMYRLLFELTDSAKLLHFTILGGSADPPAPLNDATVYVVGLFSAFDMASLPARNTPPCGRAAV